MFDLAEQSDVVNEASDQHVDDVSILGHYQQHEWPVSYDGLGTC